MNSVADYSKMADILDQIDNEYLQDEEIKMQPDDVAMMVESD